MSKSVVEKLEGRSWLLTGATGFLGSVLIEQLLRTCRPSKVVLVVLPKQGVPVMDQVAKLLSRPLYNTVREQYGGAGKLLARFEAIERDLATPEELVLPEVDVVVHAAASIAFNNHIHEAIDANFKATEAVAAAAAKMPNLLSFVHISSCYVNGDLPRGTHVPERIFPLEHQGRSIQYRALVEELMGMPHGEAEQKAAAYRQQWSFPNNYALTKRMAEHLLVDKYRDGLPLKIVRPSIIGGASLHHSSPGYIGNAGGSTAFALGVAFGMYSCTEWRPEHITDLTPVDYVSSAIILAAGAELDRSSPEPLIVQCATSAEDPMTNGQCYGFMMRMARQHPAPFTIFRGFPKDMADVHCKDAKEYQKALARADTAIKLRCLGLRLMGRGDIARVVATRWEVFKVVSCSAMDFHLFFASDNAAKLWKELSPEERELFPCVWRRGVDEWDPYLHSYMVAIWDRYVTRGGRRGGAGAGARKKKLALGVLLAATACAAAAAAVAVHSYAGLAARA